MQQHQLEKGEHQLELSSTVLVRAISATAKVVALAPVVAVAVAAVVVVAVASVASVAAVASVAVAVAVAVAVMARDRHHQAWVMATLTLTLRLKTCTPPSSTPWTTTAGSASSCADARHWCVYSTRARGGVYRLSTSRAVLVSVSTPCAVATTGDTPH